MKAMRLGSPANLASLYVSESPQIKPGRGEILMRIRASSLNYHDYMVVAGFIPTAANRIPLSDGAGEVVALGEDVTEFAVGDRVIGTFFHGWSGGEFRGSPFASVPGDGIDGYAREFVTFPAAAFTKAPANYSHAEAATLACAGVTAWRALVVDGALKAGDTVVVQGTGGVSIFALQFAKASGATVIATSSSLDKLDNLKKLGADHLINYRDNPQWGAAVRQLTDGRGADHVVDVAGSETLEQSITAARNGGHIALVGLLTGIAAPISLAAVIGNQIRMLGLTVGTRVQQQDMVRAIEARAIKPVIDASFPLEELAAAFHHQQSGKHFGKICIDI